MRSLDRGLTWEDHNPAALAIAWPDRYQTQHVKGVAVAL
jgi:hypothetical protein